MTMFRVLRNFPDTDKNPVFIADIEAARPEIALEKAKYFDHDNGVDHIKGTSRYIDAHYEAHVLANASHRVVSWHDARLSTQKKAKRK